MIILQLFLGFIVLCTTFNVKYSMNDRLKNLRNAMKETQIRVDILNDSVENGSFEYQNFTQMESDTNCDIEIVTTAIVKAVNNGNPDSIVAICVPDRYYYHIFSENMEENNVYCSQKLYNDIQNNHLRLFGSGTDISLSGESCTVNGHTYILSVIRNSSDLSEISRDENPEHNINLDKVLFFPQEAGDEWEHDEFVSFQVYFYPANSDYYLNAYKLLYQNLRDVSISIYDPAAALLKNCQDITDMIGLLTFISITLLLITIIGTIGIFLVSIYKRKEDIAIAVAVGSSLRTIYIELFIEIFIVFFSGISIGTLGAAVMTVSLKNSIPFFDTAYNLQTFLIVFISSILIPAAVTKLSLLGYGKINVTSLLHGEE